MGNNYEDSKTIKICLIGGSNGIIEKLFPDTIISTNNAQYTKRKKIQNIEAKISVSGKSSNYQIKWEAYIFPNITAENEENAINQVLFDIFGIPNLNEDINDIKKPISKNNIIIKFTSDNIEYLLDYADYLPRIYYIFTTNINNNK